MFISTFDLFKVGIGPSSSHTVGPMVCAKRFVNEIDHLFAGRALPQTAIRLKCYLKGSLALTGRGHGTNWAIALGLNGVEPDFVKDKSNNANANQLKYDALEQDSFLTPKGTVVQFNADRDLSYQGDEFLKEHSNALTFKLLDLNGFVLLSETYLSLGGGFVCSLDEFSESSEAQTEYGDKLVPPFPFHTAASMLQMCDEYDSTIAQLKEKNELVFCKKNTLHKRLEVISNAMFRCVESGLGVSGVLPGELGVNRRAKSIYEQLASHSNASLHEWLCVYAMAVNEENASGRMVVTAPTNGAAGVIPAILYYLKKHESIGQEEINEFLLTAAAIGGLIKHRSSISGAEVGCQGEVGSASAMAAAGLCAVKGGTPAQIENAAEIALEHHLGMTCDPVAGLVQIPCIERNGFGAVKAFTASSLALHGNGVHFISLDKCIAAMKETGDEMSLKFKETSMGGLAVNRIDC